MTLLTADKVEFTKSSWTNCSIWEDCTYRIRYELIYFLEAQYFALTSFRYIFWNRSTFQHWRFWFSSFLFLPEVKSVCWN